nr:hypothetical protein [Catenuloplanes japonicus]
MFDLSVIDLARCRPRRALLPAIGVLLPAAPASAHPLDAYPHAAYLTPAPGTIGIEIGLSPGIIVAPDALTGLDPDADRQITDAEARAFAGRVLANLRVEADGTPLLRLAWQRRRPSDHPQPRIILGLVLDETPGKRGHEGGATHRVHRRGEVGDPYRGDPVVAQVLRPVLDHRLFLRHHVDGHVAGGHVLGQRETVPDRMVAVDHADHVVGEQLLHRSGADGRSTDRAMSARPRSRSA